MKLSRLPPFCPPPRLFSGPPPGPPPARAGRPALLALALAALLILAGCAKPPLAGYAARQAAPAEPAHQDPAALPEGWGYVDVTCRQGQSSGRGVPDTLFGCLLHAREQNQGTVHLPRGVYLGHVAGFISQALRYYHVETNFQQLYGCRIVLLFRPATQQEREGARGGKLGRLGMGVAGEVVLTVAAGAPLIPIVTPLAFVFESVSEDMRFQEFRREAERSGLPEPSRRGDEIVAEEYSRRYGEYWEAITGEGQWHDEVSGLYVVRHCSIQREGGRPLPLVSDP